jgi:hypothetical protein
MDQTEKGENYWKIFLKKKIDLKGKENMYLFHPVSNFNTLRHQFESGKAQKTAGRRYAG